MEVRVASGWVVGLLKKTCKSDMDIMTTQTRLTTDLLSRILSLEVLMVRYPGERLTDRQPPAGLRLVVGGLTGSAGQVGPGGQVVREERVPGLPVGHHPGAALPGERDQGVLVSGRLADL